MWHRLLGILLLTVSLGGGWLWLDYRQFLDSPLRLPQEGLVYPFSPGASLSTLGQDLAHQGVLSRPLYLQVLGRLTGRAHRLQAGEYFIPVGTTPSDLLDLLNSGRVLQHPVTLVEGWTFQRFLDLLRADPRFRQTLTGTEESEEIMARLGYPGELPEGRFLPDTYYFPRGTTDVQILCRALRSMERALAVEWQRRAPGLPLASPYQALILASIVEKETALAEERPRVAGVFVRRLRLDMRLQTDPTLIYGLGAAFDGDLRRADLRRDGPYNSYTRSGLPPTPIAMPGLEAIRAVLHPLEDGSLYFVARGDGSHQFSTTLDEHERAVRRYQLRGRGSPDGP